MKLLNLQPLMASGTELMGRPLRINKAEPRGSGGSRRGGRGGNGGGNNGGGYGGTLVLLAVAVAVAMVAIMAAAALGVIMAVAMAAAAMVAAMAAVILKLILLTIIKLPEQKVGKIEAMEIPQKTQNSKVAEAGGKEEFQMRVIFQMKRINNSYLLI